MDKLPTITKSIRVFRFDPHPLRKQLTIVGETCISIARGDKVVKEFLEPLKKLVKLLGLTHSSKPEAVVNDIIQTFPFIEGNSLRASLKEIVEEILNREYDGNGAAIMPRTASDGSYLPRYLEVFDEVENTGSARLSKLLKDERAEVDIRQLNHYVEMLYENISSKVEGVRLISNLTKFNRYLIEVSEHASASNAIFRTLREDSAKSTNLTVHIFSICLDFARFHCFHRFLVRHKLPPRVLDIIDFQLERCEKWKAQLIKREELARSESSIKAIEDFANSNEQFLSQVELQNNILQLGFDILHYLSEDRIVAVSLIHQGLVTSLTDALDRTNFALWESVISYLKDMSSFKEYIEQMITVDTLGKLAKILKGKAAIPMKLARVCFGLLCNLSFNAYLRNEIVRLGLLSVLGNCLSKSSLADIVAKTLYLISMDVHNRGKIAKGGVSETLLGQLAPEIGSVDQISRIKGALAVNLARDLKGATLMGESLKLAVLLKHSIKNHDILGMKIVRNVVQTRPSPIIDQQAGHIAKAVVEVNSLDFALECVGTLANLNVETVSFPELLKKNRLVVWLKRQIMNYMNMTNVAALSYQLKIAALEVVILLSNISKKEDGARFIVGEGFIDRILIHLLNGAGTDPQIVQQIVYLFNVCCQHEPVATFLVTKTQFPQDFMAFALNIGGKVRRQCDATLHKLSEFDESWHETIMEHQFLTFNEKWTSTVSEQIAVSSEQSENGSFSKSHLCSGKYRDRLQGAGESYAGIIDDDEEDLWRPSSCDITSNILEDSSTTDAEDESYCLDPKGPFAGSSWLFPDNRLDARSKGSLNLHELYEQYEEEMASSQDWKFFSK